MLYEFKGSRLCLFGFQVNFMFMGNLEVEDRAASGKGEPLWTITPRGPISYLHFFLAFLTHLLSIQRDKPSVSASFISYIVETTSFCVVYVVDFKQGDIEWTAGSLEKYWSWKETRKRWCWR